MKEEIFQNEAFAKAIKAKRTKLGIGVRGLSDIGIIGSTVSRIENGKNPDLETYVRLCRWLKKPFGTYIKK